MLINKRKIEQIIFKQFANNVRFTQDSPIYPDVWLQYFGEDNIKIDLKTYRADLILTPHRQATAADLFLGLSNELRSEHFKKMYDGQSPWDMASSGETVVAKLTLFELITVALPMTYWWHFYLWKADGKPTAELRWIRMLIGAILMKGKSTKAPGDAFTEEVLLELEEYCNANFDSLVDNGNSTDKKKKTKGKEKPAIQRKLKAGIIPPWFIKPVATDQDNILLWSVNRNRPASISLEHSVGTTKADASRKLFDIDGSGITWAVLDTGIDVRHPAFRKRDPKTGKMFKDALGKPEDRNSNNTRIIASYDFTKFRTILAEIYKNEKKAKNHPRGLFKVTSDRNDKKLTAEDEDDYIREIALDLNRGRLLDWTVISPLLRIPHNNKEYELNPPQHPHGTHVGGIIAASELDDNGKCTLLGMCPGINLYDIRVLDHNGAGEEFNILAALQFVRWLNNQKEGQIIHGVNLSFSMIHSVASYACGATPVCESCERLVAEGTVVVAAAGNLGQAMYQGTDGNIAQGFRMVNITDPGNAETVITVGSTHRDRPHSYGVSYFSSKGPTGDGRVKPDLVAPGEKIISSVLGNATDRMDGTSMAAPHVSGAAALLLAKHRELIGRPRRVKDILCKTATDLGREKYFQGCGMVDVLRAIQSV
jgi:serine protease AprX